LPTQPTLLLPAEGATGVGTTMEFRWARSTDPCGDKIMYDIYYCITPDTVGCTRVAQVADTTVAKQDSKSIFYAGGAGLFMIGMTFFGGLKGRKKIIALLIMVSLAAGGVFMSCKNTKGVDMGSPLGATEMNYMASGLTPNTTYYWKIVADDNKGGLVSSPSQSFTTQ
jgi:hypothetical protein